MNLIFVPVTLLEVLDIFCIVGLFNFLHVWKLIMVKSDPESNSNLTSLFKILTSTYFFLIFDLILLDEPRFYYFVIYSVNLYVLLSRNLDIFCAKWANTQSMKFSTTKTRSRRGEANLFFQFVRWVASSI